MFSIVGRVPARGEVVRHPSGLEFEVLEADPRRVKTLKIYRVREPQSAAVSGKTAPPMPETPDAPPDPSAPRKAAE